MRCCPAGNFNKVKYLKIIGIALLVTMLGLQFFPIRPNQSAIVPVSDFVKTYKVPEQVIQILHTSCYNCHSNDTNYPWYSRVQPLSWFLQYHIIKGKEELNFSEFGFYSGRKQKSKLSSIIKQVNDNKMPLPSYVFIHRDARLPLEQKEVLIEYFKGLKESH